MDGNVPLKTEVAFGSSPLRVLVTVPTPPSDSKPHPLRLDVVHKETQRAIHSLFVGEFTYSPQSDVNIKIEDSEREESPRPTKRRSLDDDDDDDWVQRPRTKSLRTSRSLRRSPNRNGSRRSTTSWRAESLKPSPPLVLESVAQQLDSSYVETKLSFLNNWKSMAYGWKPEEASAGRRLVRFERVAVGGELQIKVASVLQDDWSADKDKKLDAKTISCIYNPAVDGCCITSTEAILLMEYLTDVPEIVVTTPFAVDHKNRIRRLLEVFKPSTVHRSLPSQGDFFNAIMDIPEPQPRGIRKDVKVFDWSSLASMLEKVIGKLPFKTSVPTPESTPPMSPESQCSSLGFVNQGTNSNPAIKRSDSRDSTPSLRSPGGSLADSRPGELTYQRNTKSWVSLSPGEPCSWGTCRLLPWRE